MLMTSHAPAGPTTHRATQRGCSSRRSGNGRRPATSAGGSADPGARRCLGQNGLRLDQWRAEGRLTTVKSGPHRIVYRVDLARGSHLRQALPRARLPGHVPPVVPPGQGTQRGEAIRGARLRSASRPSTRSPWASSGSGSSCSRITWSPGKSRARFRSTSSSRSTWTSCPNRARSRIRRRLASVAGRSDGTAAQRGDDAHRLPSRATSSSGSAPRRHARADHDRPGRPAHRAGS